MTLALAHPPEPTPTATLKPPSGWPPERAFPPTVEEARALLTQRGLGRGVRTFEASEDSIARACDGARADSRYPARQIVYAAALAATGDETSMLEAYAILRDVASATVRHPPTRAVALHNAAVVLARIRTRSILALAESAAKDALALVDGRTREELRALVLDIHDDLMGLQRPVPMRYDAAGASLVADAEHARDRIAGIPERGIEGRYAGLRVALLDYGLKGPRTIAVASPVRLVPRPERLALAIERA